MTLGFAPFDTVPEGVSRYRPLPLLVKCNGCDTPLQPWQTWSVVLWQRLYGGLCEACAYEGLKISKGL